jgi:hypothetical protein
VARIGKGLRVVALVFSFVVLLLLATGAYSIIPGNLDISVSEEVEPDPQVELGLLRLRVPATIVNRGFYDIRDVVVQIDATDSNHTPVFQARSNSFAIAAGSVFNDYVVVTVNLTDAFTVHGSYYLFHSANLTVDVMVSCRYLLSLFGVTLRVSNLTMPWAAPLQDFSLNITQAALIPYGGESALNATLAMTHNGWLEFNQTTVRSELLHVNGTLITSNQTAVDLRPGEQRYAITFPLTDAWEVYLTSNNVTLRVNCALAPLGINISHTQLVSWIVPPSGGPGYRASGKVVLAAPVAVDSIMIANPPAADRSRATTRLPLRGCWRRSRDTSWFDSVRCYGGGTQ